MTTFFAYFYAKHTGTLLQEKIIVTANTLHKYLLEREHNTWMAAVSASENKNIINAVSKRDTDKLMKLLTDMLGTHFVDFFVVTDGKGTVLTRTLTPDYGDSILYQSGVQEALKGHIYTSSEEGSIVKVSIRTASPVFDNNGNISGVIVAGIRLDSNETVDNFKKQFNTDVSVFFDNTRMATTIIQDKKRVVGTQLNPAIAKVVLEDKNEYFGHANVSGTEYSAFYMPLKNSQGKVFAIFSVAQSNEDLITERNLLIRNSVFIGLLGVIISILILLFITQKITKPIKSVVYLVSEVTRGNIDIEIDRKKISEDEIGKLTGDIYSLVDIVKSTIRDLSNLTHGLNIYGDMNYSIDTSKYSGSYKEIIEGIKALSDSVLIMKKAMAVMDDLDVMICVSSFDYSLLYVNRSLAERFEVDRTSSLGQKCHKVIYGLDEPCPHCQLPQVRNSKDHSLRTFSFHDVWNDSAQIWMGGRAAAISWIDRSTVYMHSTYDETEKKVYELHLDKALKEAEAASVAKSSFLANMSHEIRTPMNSIIGFSELALDDDISFKTKDYLKNIIGNAEGLLQIINDILDISKIESGNMKLENIPFDIHELITLCRSIITPKVIEKGLELYLSAEPAIEKILIGDATKLRQVLLNLLSNAVKFTDSGKVSLFVKVDKYSEKTITLRFEVKDSGIGMTPAQITKITEPFTQADISTTRKYGGTGLGLSILKNILEIMNSKLEIESAPGVGSRFSFTITLDTTDEEITVNSIADKLEKPMFHGKVLVCEDNEMNQLVITEHLAKVGLKTEIAKNGQEGIDKIIECIERKEKPYDLIFMDIHMPVMDGITATPEIIKLGTKTPIVALTANSMSGDRELYKKLGMSDYIGKPLTSQDLWHTLLKFLKPVSFVKTENADNNFQIKLIKEFVKSNQTKFDEITEAIDTGDIKLAHRLAHTLKSTASLIGMVVLHKAAADVESALKKGNIPVEAARMSLLKTELENSLEDLKLYLNKNEIPVPTETSVTSVDAVKARELFDKLEPLLKSGNTECLGIIDDLRTIPKSETLIEQMETFYFSEALKTLMELKKNIG
jgi:signal transduction histidine kinase/DNA-binding response OmpR family regulator/HAMP domain-containing protein